MVKTDEQLVALIVKKDRAALNELIRRYIKLGYFIAYQYTKNQAEAEDIVQDIFVKIWQKIKKFDQQKKFKSWFYEIAKNTSLDHLRKRQDISFTEWEQTTGREINQLLVDNQELNNQIDQDLAYNYVNQVRQTLPNKYEEVLDLYYQQGLNFREIAEKVGQSVNTIKSRYRRALLFIKKQINLKK